MVWRFVEFYGWDAFENAYWRQYTVDGVIPFKMFILAASSLRHGRAESELIAAHAGAFAQAIALGGSKDMKLKAYTRNLVRNAYPQDVSE